MADVTVLSAESRELTGKGPNRRLRAAGRVPAIIYGGKDEPVLVSLGIKELRHELHASHFFATLCELEVGGSKVRVLPREVQLHPVNDDPLHADFVRVTKGATITVEVPVTFINEEECPGLKRGGVVNVVRREVELSCPIESIPSELILDLAEADIGDSLHISHITLPDGVAPTITDRDFTVATIVPPTVQAVEEEEGAEDEEGEVPVLGEDEAEAEAVEEED